MTTSMKRRVRSAADRAASAVGWLARRERTLTDALTVLTYHRVLPDECCATYPFPSLAMPLGLFREQVRWLAEQGEVLPLVQALARPHTTNRPRFALTFDDGYADACDTVSEVLEASGLRGTFFVTTRFVGSDRLLWFDEAALLLVGIPHAARRGILFDVCGSDAPVPRTESLPDTAVGAWVAHMKTMTPAQRDAFLAGLASVRAGVPDSTGYRAMTIDGLVDMHRRGHEIGSHSATHPILTTLDDGELEREIGAARRTLSGWLGTSVPGFCYPNGDHDARVVAAVAGAGHVYACTTRDGLHHSGDDAFRIRRVDIVDERVSDAARRFDPIAFRRELCGLYRWRRS